MHVRVTFVGILGKLIQEGSFEVHFPQEATYQDLLKEVWDRFGHSIPGPLWDKERNRFQEPIFALANGRAVDSPDTPLADGEEVTFLTLIAGG
jgi:molybdopterin converting factor small subunit